MIIITDNLSYGCESAAMFFSLLKLTARLALAAIVLIIFYESFYWVYEPQTESLGLQVGNQTMASELLENNAS
jgi:hypothetical protein